MALGSLNFLEWVLLACNAAGCLYLAFAARAVWRFAARPRLAAPAPAAVTVLKPLYGADFELEANLRSFCRQDNPSFQIVCGVRDSDDAAIPIVRRLMAEYPAIDLSLVVDDRRCGANAKVANLQNMLPAARHPILVIADSDMRVGPNYLRDVTAPLADAENGLVTCLYRGVAGPGLWSALACQHVNHGFLPQALVADALGAGEGCFGATLALGRDTLDAAGGFAAFADALADDHALGAAVRRLGKRVVLSRVLVDNIIAEPGPGGLFRHELRWAKTTRLLAPLGYAGTIITQPVALALIALALAPTSLAAMAMLGLALLCRLTMVRLVDRALGLPATPVVLVPFRDLLSFAVFLASFFIRSVEWRDHTFRVGPGGKVTLDGDFPA